MNIANCAKRLSPKKPAFKSFDYIRYFGHSFRAIPLPLNETHNRLCQVHISNGQLNFLPKITSWKHNDADHQIWEHAVTMVTWK